MTVCEEYSGLGVEEVSSSVEEDSLSVVDPRADRWSCELPVVDRSPFHRDACM